MSAGHHHKTGVGPSHEAINAVLSDPRLHALVDRCVRIDRSYDLPYLAGYSNDGKTVYIDRHLPATLGHKSDKGHTTKFDPQKYLVIHETWEKALIDGCGWNYHHAHAYAEKIEDRQALMDGLSPQRKEAIFRPYIKADEHEKLTRVPRDLDMTPYLAAPMNRRLVAHMRSVQKGR